eukprot:gnl/TRDRNA2_/TRDRNA2_136693_c0_seq2.p1 gnl/TRDRNA2_/TRDRNA2_136693_c0~~gnl/TRDRNA2_/TRDRNA2_136693_c0_seq2.p1  ORF type:complete len:359 (+),score=70.81 gnl/TRDRNA2_/TRDRNA2_136693_c0_seq2:41-1078(+)
MIDSDTAAKVTPSSAERDAAATKLQSVARRKAAKREAAAKREEKAKAAPSSPKLPAPSSPKLRQPSPSSASARNADLSAAAVKIQSAARGKKARAMKKKSQNAAIKIQSIQRGRRQRKAIKLNLDPSVVDSAQALRSAVEQNEELMGKLELINTDPPPEEIDLRSSYLGEPGMALLAAKLADNKTLRKLNLDGNYIGSKGLLHLAGPLEGCRGLKKLQLAWNAIGDEGVKTFGGFFHKLPGLTDVDLSYNRIGDVGAERLMNILERKTPVKVLNLMGNIFGQRGASLLTSGCGERIKVTLPWFREDASQVVTYDPHSKMGPGGGRRRSSVSQGRRASVSSSGSGR